MAPRLAFELLCGRRLSFYGYCWVVCVHWALIHYLLYFAFLPLSSSWFVGVYLVDRFLNLVVCL